LSRVGDPSDGDGERTRPPGPLPDLELTTGGASPSTRQSPDDDRDAATSVLPLTLDADVTQLRPPPVDDDVTGYQPGTDGETVAGYTVSTSGHQRPDLGSEGPLEVGLPFGARYHIIRVLGIGGMGAVYQAWDAELGVAVAIKVIRPEIAADPVMSGKSTVSSTSRCRMSRGRISPRS
jgi:serine/threonine protein kinase